MISKSWNRAETRSLPREISWDRPAVSVALDEFIAKGTIAVLIFTALAHGAVEPWSVALFEVMVTGLLLLWGIKALADRHLEISVPLATIPILAFLALGLVQSIAFAGGTGSRLSLSMDVEATRHAVTTLIFLTGSFLLAANFLITKERLLLLSNVLTGFGTLLAVFALIQYFTWDHRMYWLRATPYDVFGPFVNRNHFAGYMAMLAPIPIGLMLTVVRGQARLIYGFAAVIMGIAAIVSGSRSGVFSLFGALLFIALLSRRRTQNQSTRLSRIASVAIVAVAIVGGVLWIGATPVIERFGRAVDALVHSEGPDLSRPEIWRDTLRVIRTYPILGTGLGSYATVYPAHAQTAEHFGLNYAHNDYLQVLADNGIAGGFIVIGFAAIILIGIYRGLRSTDPLSGGMSLAAGAGIIAVAIQSLSDTDLQIPSNALLFLVLTAVVSRIGSRKIELMKNDLENEQ